MTEAARTLREIAIARATLEAELIDLQHRLEQLLRAERLALDTWAQEQSEDGGQ